MSTFKLSDLSDYRKLKDISKTQKNRRNKKRRRERKREWKATNPKPERRITEHTEAERNEPASVSDVLKAVSAKRRKAK